MTLPHSTPREPRDPKVQPLDKSRFAMRRRLIPLLLLVGAVGVASAVAGLTRGNRGGTAPARTGSTPAPHAVRFTDMAQRAGLRFAWKPNPKRPLRVLDTFGCGCAFLDFDQDGLLDILLVGEPRSALYRNVDGQRFEDISQQVGLHRHTALWKGCAVGDFDGDGYPDILLTAYRRLLLLANARGKTLRDVTQAVGLPPDNHLNWGSSAGWMDLDGDRDLDLVVLNYVVFNEKTPQLCELTPGVKSGCPPQTYQPEFGRLYRNDGGVFRDVTKSAGFSDANGKGLVVGFADFNNDGRVDFYVGNDGTPAELMENLGGLRFRNVGQESGVAFGAVAGQAIAAMGVDWADYNRDGRLDFAVTGFEGEAYCLYANEGQGLFRVVSDETGITEPTFRPLGFGTSFLDVDNDGYPDVVFANGHVYDNVDQITPGMTFRQPLMLFHNEQGRRFTDIAPRLGEPWTRPIVGRGTARGDYDNDGRMDLLVVDYEGAPLLLHNETDTGNHWLQVRARGLGRNREGYGLRATARSGAQTWVGEISPAASYLSTSAPRIHLGLGKVARLDSLTLRWPSGATSTLKDVAADQMLTVEEPPSPTP